MMLDEDILEGLLRDLGDSLTPRPDGAAAVIARRDALAGEGIERPVVTAVRGVRRHWVLSLAAAVLLLVGSIAVLGRSHTTKSFKSVGEAIGGPAESGNLPQTSAQSRSDAVAAPASPGLATTGSGASGAASGASGAIGVTA